MNKKSVILRSVILSGVETSRSEVSTQSKACPELAEADSLRTVILSEAFFAERRTCGSPRAATRPLRRNKREATLLISLALAILFLTTYAAAETLTGTVKNATTGKPAAGDDVVLLKLGQGMEEAGRTKTDANGKFSFKIADAQAPYLIRDVHQDVTFNRMAPPGSTSVEIEVSDVAQKVDNVTVAADIMRVEAQTGKLIVVREFGVQNASRPPRTQMNDHNIEFNIPDGAQVIPDSGSATTENGRPVKSAPVPQSEKNRYAFIFPLRPGLTRFEVAYQLPYNGSASLDPKSLYPLDHFVVMLPKSMQFTAADTSSNGFKLVDYTQEPNAAVEVASSTKLGQGQSGPPPNANAQGRPGGGLGPPIDAPDPLQKYRWWILGGFAAALVLGGIFIALRQQSAARAMARGRTAAPAGQMIEDDYAPADIPTRASARPGSMLMEGIKEELFQLEVERRQGTISQAEYEQAKSALDQTLDRALKREAQKA